MAEAKKLIQIVGGLPIAIDIIAQTLARRPFLTFSEYVEDLKEPLEVLNLELANKKVGQAIYKSINTLNKDSYNMLVSLGACTESGFSLNTAKVVSGNVDIRKTRKYLMTLYDFSLIKVINSENSIRYALHPIIRSFAKSRIEIKDALLRHAKLWCEYVSKYKNDSKEDWIFLLNEWNGIKEAWDWCCNAILLQKDTGLSEPTLIYKILIEMSYHLRYFVDGIGFWVDFIDRAPSLLLAIEKQEDNINNIEMKFRIRRHLSIIYRKLGKLELAADLNITNIEFAIKQNRKDWEAQEYEILGRVRTRQERFTEARKYYIIALQNASTKRYQSQALNCLGELHRKINEYDTAIEYFTKSLNIYYTLKDDQGICSTLSHIGNCYLSSNNLHMAKKYFSKALIKYEDSKKIEVEGSLYQNIGKLFESEEKYLFALICYKISKQISNALGIEGWGNNIISQTTWNNIENKLDGIEKMEFLQLFRDDSILGIDKARDFMKAIIFEYAEK